MKYGTAILIAVKFSQREYKTKGTGDDISSGLIIRFLSKAYYVNSTVQHCFHLAAVFHVNMGQPVSFSSIIPKFRKKEPLKTTTGTKTRQVLRTRGAGQSMRCTIAFPDFRPSNSNLQRKNF